MRLTDMADELYAAAADLPGGVRTATARRGGVTVTRVEIAREGLEKPRGRYVTLEVPSVSVLDERDAEVIEQAAEELRALVPPEGPVLVLGIGNRRVTADALGPRTAQKILVTMGPQHTLPVKGIRPVAAIAPGVSASTGLTLRQLAGAMVEAVRPAALICVDSLCSAEGARLGRSVQFSDTGLYPAQADHAKHLDAAALGVPVIAAGIPTLMDSDEGADLVVTPRALVPSTGPCSQGSAWRSCSGWRGNTGGPEGRLFYAQQSTAARPGAGAYRAVSGSGCSVCRTVHLCPHGGTDAGCGHYCTAANGRNSFLAGAAVRTGAARIICAGGSSTGQHTGSGGILSATGRAGADREH